MGKLERQVMMLKKLENRVKDHLSPARWEHTQGVIEASLLLVDCHGLSIEPQRVQIAALLHDCAKDLSLRDQLKRAADFGIVLTSSDLLCPKTLHGPVGAGIARHIYGIEDRDILRAIALHTTGAPGMTVLAKIIFLADYIEPGRRFPNVERLRAIAVRNLDEAVLSCMNHTLNHLLVQGVCIHQRMIAARNYLLATVLDPRLRKEG